MVPVKKQSDIYELFGKIVMGFVVTFVCVAITCGIIQILRATF